jgi:hypothetical protein
MTLGSNQPLVKMSTRNIPGGKGGQCVRLKTSPPSRAECHEIWEPKPSWILWTTPGRLRDSFTLYAGSISIWHRNMPPSPLKPLEQHFFRHPVSTFSSSFIAFWIVLNKSFTHRNSLPRRRRHSSDTQFQILCILSTSHLTEMWVGEFLHAKMGRVMYVQLK